MVYLINNTVQSYTNLNVTNFKFSFLFHLPLLHWFNLFTFVSKNIHKFYRQLCAQHWKHLNSKCQQNAIIGMPNSNDGRFLIIIRFMTFISVIIMSYKRFRDYMTARLERSGEYRVYPQVVQNVLKFATKTSIFRQSLFAKLI